jgi:hypothetical protein
MVSVYLVKSGRYEESVGYTEWLNLRAFTEYEAARSFLNKIKTDLGDDFNEDKDFLEIEDITLEG